MVRAPRGRDERETSRHDFVIARRGLGQGHGSSVDLPESWMRKDMLVLCALLGGVQPSRTYNMAIL
eukprot:2261259-Pyramimonas_sp.AAC.1